MDKYPCLAGSWLLQTEKMLVSPIVQDDYSEIYMGIDKYGSKLRSDTSITIHQLSRKKEQLLLTYKTSNEENFVVYNIEELNIVDSPGGLLFCTVVGFDDMFKSLSITILSSDDNCKLIEEYNLIEDCLMEVSYTLNSFKIPQVVIIRSFQRLPSALLPIPIIFSSGETIRNWSTIDFNRRNESIFTNTFVKFQAEEGDSSFAIKVCSLTLLSKTFDFKYIHHIHVGYSQ